MIKKRCYHSRNSWLIAGGGYEWCYRCGAIRRMKSMGVAKCEPETKWLKPTGNDGKNPIKLALLKEEK